MTETDKLKNLLLDTYYKGKDGKSYSDYELKEDLSILEKELSKARIDELEDCLKQWEHPNLAPHWITDRMAELEKELTK